VNVTSSEVDGTVCKTISKRSVTITIQELINSRSQAVLPAVSD